MSEFFDFVLNLKKKMALYTTTFSAPSNIAVVKYWGKRDAGKLNLPLNSSLSVTMDQVGFL